MKTTFLLILPLAALIMFTAAVLMSCESGDDDDDDDDDNEQPAPEDMVLIPGGNFVMGSDAADAAADAGPAHTVKLDSFYIDVNEVTNAQYKQCVEAGGCIAPPERGSATRERYYDTATYADYPVVNVNWYEASYYCLWADKRLPTEAEWELAAKGQDDPDAAYPWGDAEPDCSYANFNPGDTACIDDTTEVGSYLKGESPFGLSDTAGNAFEWVADWYAEDYYDASPAANPEGPDSGSEKGLRGGSWDSDAASLTVYGRRAADPSNRSNQIGFRCAESR